jgi:methionyl-tRNA formyltransferase
MINVIVLTSNNLRHNYISEMIAKSLNVIGLIIEEKSKFIKNNYSGDDKHNLLLVEHFERRTNSENEFFGHMAEKSSNFDKISIFNGTVNSESIFDWLKLKNPDYLILFGTSLIKSPIIDYFENRIINIHLGLSPYYKGSGTNLWPLYFNEPECVGATIHLATKNVDSGGILFQLRPEIELTDNIHTIGNKVIKLVGLKIGSIINAYHNNLILPVTQNETIGSVFYNRDFNEKILEVIYSNFENGMVGSYLTNKHNRLLNRPIINYDFI